MKTIVFTRFITKCRCKHKLSKCSEDFIFIIIAILLDVYQNWKGNTSLPHYRLGSVITDTEFRGGKGHSKDLRHGVAKTMLKLLSGEETITVLNQKASAKDITFRYSNGTVHSGKYVFNLAYVLHYGCILFMNWTFHSLIKIIIYRDLYLTCSFNSKFQFS